MIYHECLLKIKNKTIQTTTLTDTGNTLITPFSKEPVIILDPCILCKFIPRQIIDEYVKTNYFDYKKAIFFGGEDYRLVCAISDEDLSKIDKNIYTIIGEIQEKSDEDTVKVSFKGQTIGFNANSLEKNLFNHF